MTDTMLEHFPGSETSAHKCERPHRFLRERKACQRQDEGIFDEGELPCHYPKETKCYRGHRNARTMVSATGDTTMHGLW